MKERALQRLNFGRLVRYLHDAAPDVDDLVKSTANISGLSEFLAFM
jgi:hypothetical protein